MDIKHLHFDSAEFFQGQTELFEKLNKIPEVAKQVGPEDLQKQLGVAAEGVNPQAWRALAVLSVSNRSDFVRLRSLLEALPQETKLSVLNTFAMASDQPILSNYLVYATKGLSEKMLADFFQTHESCLADIPIQAAEIYGQVVSAFPDFDLSPLDIEEILRFRVKENIANLIKRMDYGEYGPELYQDVIGELKDVPAQEQFAVHLFKIIARMLEQENVELGKFEHFQQMVLERLRVQHQTGMFNKTLERLGHLKMVPEIHWRVDRDSQEYNRRLGVNLNAFLQERARGSESKEVLLEIGSGNGKAKKQRAELGLANSYEDYALTDEVYFPLSSVIEKLIDFEKLESDLGVELSDEDRVLLADFIYRTFAIKAGQGDRDDFGYDERFKLQMEYGINYLRYYFSTGQGKLALADTMPQTISTRDNQGKVAYPYKIKAREQSVEFQSALGALQSKFTDYLIQGWDTMDYYGLVETFPPNTIISDMSQIGRLKSGQVGVEIALRSTVYKKEKEYVEFLEKLVKVLKPGGVALDDSIRDNDGWYYRIAEVLEAKKSMPAGTEILVVLGQGFKGEDYRQDLVPLSMAITKQGSSRELIQKHLQPGCKLILLEDLAEDGKYLESLDATGRTARRAEEAPLPLALAA